VRTLSISPRGGAGTVAAVATPTLTTAMSIDTIVSLRPTSLMPSPGLRFTFLPAPDRIAVQKEAVPHRVSTSNSAERRVAAEVWSRPVVPVFQYGATRKAVDILNADSRSAVTIERDCVARWPRDLGRRPRPSWRADPASLSRARARTREGERSTPTTPSSFRSGWGPGRGRLRRERSLLHPFTGTRAHAQGVPHSAA
jgi:hypothetical protein